MTCNIYKSLLFIHIRLEWYLWFWMVCWIIFRTIFSVWFGRCASSSKFPLYPCKKRIPQPNSFTRSIKRPSLSDYKSGTSSARGNLKWAFCRCWWQRRCCGSSHDRSYGVWDPFVVGPFSNFLFNDLHEFSRFTILLKCENNNWFGLKWLIIFSLNAYVHYYITTLILRFL